MTRQDYITVAPATPKGKWQILARRIGSNDRFAPFAETKSESAADTIVAALVADQAVRHTLRAK